MAFVKKIKDIHGENLAEKVGTVQDYLGMTFDYSFDDKVRINIIFIESNRTVSARDFGKVRNTGCRSFIQN
jgi:hypothetical protein